MALTTARLRDDIDRGRSGDKVDNIDPAAAPLGTDDEAAGTPPTPVSVRLAYAHEVGPGTSTGRRDEDHGVVLWIAAVAAIWSVIISAVIFVRP